MKDLLSLHRLIERDDHRAISRLENRIGSMLISYCIEQNIAVEDLQKSLQEDPNRLETFYLEAIATIPDTLLPRYAFEIRKRSLANA